MKTLGSYIALGVTLVAFVGLFPFMLNKFGVKLELGIIIDAVCIGLFVPILLKTNEQHN